MLSLAISQFPFTAALLLLINGRPLQAKSVIVDDSDTSRIIYSSGWNIGNNCTICRAEPDPTRPSNGTWHDGTASSLFIPFFTFKFTGTSVEAHYVAIDIIQTSFDFTTGTNVSYSIDGHRLGTTVRNPADRGAYVYNQSLFSIGGLSNTEHTLRVELLRPSVLLLDYLVYDDGSTVASSTATSTSNGTSPSVSSTANGASSTPSTNIGAIVGGVVAAVIVLVLGVVLLWYFRYRGREISQSRPLVQPYDPNSTGSGAHPDLRMATVQRAVSSRFYGSSDTAGQVTYNFSQIGQTPVPQRSVSSHKSIYDPAGSGPNPPRTSSTSYYAPTTPGRPPSSFHSHAVADGEPVEAGLMSRAMLTRDALPLYGPGGVQRDEGAPPLPGQWVFIYPAL